MDRRRRAVLLITQLLLITTSHSVLAGRSKRSAREPGQVGQVRGVPECPPGLPACGLHGCYTPLLTRCDPNNGCISVKLVSQLSALIRFGSSAAESAGKCTIPFANTCGDAFCGMHEVCVGGVCQSNSPIQFSAANIDQSPAAANAACQAARHGSAHCAGDASELATVDCNAIGVAAVKGIYCFQSQLFNCAVQPGGSATFTCRGIAGVAQAVTEVFNSTLNTAAAMAADMADALAKQEQQQLLAGGPNAVSASSQVPVVLSGPFAGSSAAGRVDGGEDSWLQGVLSDPAIAAGDGSSSSSMGGGPPRSWRAEANAALGSLGHAVRDKGQPLLQPIFQNLADIVNNASKSLFNISAEAKGAVEGVGKPAFMAGRQQSTFNLGPAPIRDTAGALPQHTPLLMLVAALSAGFLAMF